MEASQQIQLPLALPVKPRYGGFFSSRGRLCCTSRLPGFFRKAPGQASLWRLRVGPNTGGEQACLRAEPNSTTLKRFSLASRTAPQSLASTANSRTSRVFSRAIERARLRDQRRLSARSRLPYCRKSHRTEGPRVPSIFLRTTFSGRRIDRPLVRRNDHGFCGRNSTAWSLQLAILKLTVQDT